MRSSIIHLRERHHSNPWGMSALLSQGLRATFALIGLLVMAPPADALIIRDQCNQTSGDGQGHNCPPGDYLLIRPKYSTGQCGDWMCCPANGDGSYNCDKAVNPTSSAVSGALKNILGPRATMLEPGRNPVTKNPSIFHNQNAPVLRRGVDGEAQDPGIANPSKTAPAIR